MAAGFGSVLSDDWMTAIHIKRKKGEKNEGQISGRSKLRQKIQGSAAMIGVMVRIRSRYWIGATFRSLSR